MTREKWGGISCLCFKDVEHFSGLMFLKSSDITHITRVTMRRRTHTHSHPHTQGPWAAPSALRFRWTHRDISYVSLWNQLDDSRSVLCVNTPVCTCYVLALWDVSVCFQSQWLCEKLWQGGAEWAGSTVRKMDMNKQTMNSWIQRQWGKRGAACVNEAGEAPPEGLRLFTVFRAVEKISFLHSWITNCSQEPKSLRRQCTLLYVLFSLFFILHQHSFPLGRVLPSPLVLCVQLSGAVWGIVLNRTAACIICHNESITLALNSKII